MLSLSEIAKPKQEKTSPLLKGLVLSSLLAVHLFQHNHYSLQVSVYSMPAAESCQRYRLYPPIGTFRMVHSAR